MTKDIKTNQHSVYTQCWQCGERGINNPETLECGNCNSLNTSRYYAEEDLEFGLQQRAKDRKIVAQEWQPISKYPQDSLKSRLLTDGQVVVNGWLEGVSFSGETYYAYCQANGKSRIWPTHFMELPKLPITKEKDD